jgi:hypothetical protein
LLIDLVVDDLIPLLLQAGFAPSPEAAKGATNQFGLIWGSNELAFQDRAQAIWPTIVLKVDRGRDPNLFVELCEIPQEPVMLDGTHLAREEANVGHCVRALRLRKGRSDSYKDQHFGASFWSFSKEKSIRRDLGICASLLARIVAARRASFLPSVEQALEPKFLYLSWDERDALRPNRSVV